MEFSIGVSLTGDTWRINSDSSVSVPSDTAVITLIRPLKSLSGEMVISSLTILIDPFPSRVAPNVNGSSSISRANKFKDNSVSSSIFCVGVSDRIGLSLTGSTFIIKLRSRFKVKRIDPLKS